MSADKKQGVVAVSSGVVVGGGTHKSRFYTRLSGLILAGIIILAVVGAAIFATVHHNKKSAITPPLPPQAAKPHTPEELANTGNVTAAQQLLSNQLKTAKTADEKANIYTRQTTIAINAKDYVAAKQYEVQADDLLHSDATEYMLGYIAQLSGDTKTAASYYQKAIASLNASDINKAGPRYSQTLKDYQNALGEVSK